MLPVKVFGIVFRKSSAASVCWFCKARCTAWAPGSERARAEEHLLLVCKLPAKLILNNCLEYLFAVPVGYLEGFIVWNEFLFHSLLFFPAMKDFSKITCLTKPEAFLSTILRHMNNSLTFMCKKGRYQDIRCFEGRVREDKYEDCW